MLNFYPKKSSKIETNNNISFSAYYDKDDSTWKSNDIGSNFLISLEGDNLEFKCFNGNTIGFPITEWKKNFNINKNGFVDNKRSKLFPIYNISKPTTILNMFYNQAILIFHGTDLYEERQMIEIPYPESDALPHGFGCFLLKDNSYIGYDYDVMINISGNTILGASAWETTQVVVYPELHPGRWMQYLSKRPILKNWEMVYLHKMDKYNWLVEYGRIEEASYFPDT